MPAIEEAVKLLGGQTEVANLLSTTNKKVKQNSIFYWVNKYKQAPAKYINKISKLTNNQITIVELLADHERNNEANNEIMCEQ